MNVLSALSWNANSWKNPSSTTDFIVIIINNKFHRDTSLKENFRAANEGRQTSFFSKIHPATQTTGAYE